MRTPEFFHTGARTPQVWLRPALATPAIRLLATVAFSFVGWFFLALMMSPPSHAATGTGESCPAEHACGGELRSLVSEVSELGRVEPGMLPPSVQRHLPSVKRHAASLADSTGVGRTVSESVRKVAPRKHALLPAAGRITKRVLAPVRTHRQSAQRPSALDLLLGRQDPPPTEADKQLVGDLVDRLFPSTRPRLIDWVAQLTTGTPATLAPAIEPGQRVATLAGTPDQARQSLDDGRSAGASGHDRDRHATGTDLPGSPLAPVTGGDGGSGTTHTSGGQHLNFGLDVPQQALQGAARSFFTPLHALTSLKDVAFSGSPGVVPD
ncbi:hypothetical protein [Spirillospora sp. CA-294931]|uniref:hypothetical protein n=1 Tax=Spirillospora sp. CA-294931 TaxID=3240042 RepID=UPI003D8ED565